MKRFLFGFIAMAVIAGSCTKTPKVPLGTDGMLRTGKWKIGKSLVTMRMPNGQKATVDYGTHRSACLVDNYLKFDSLNRGSVHNNGASCSNADADSIAFIWTLKNNDQNIDLLGLYTVVDSVIETVVLNSTGTAYEAQYSTGPSYISNLRNATITGFSQSSFTLEYDFKGKYPDTTAAKGGSPAAPIILDDTFRIHITYNNF